MAGPAMSALLFFAILGLAQAATLSIPANGDYSGGGQYSSITVSGGHSVSISGQPLIITGPGGTSGMFNPRNGAIRVNGTTLQLGTSSATGGTFAAAVGLAANGHLSIFGSDGTTAYSLGSNSITTAVNNTGSLTLSGAGGLHNVTSVGSQNALLARIGMNGDMRLAVRDGVWARQIALENGAQITLQQGSLALPADSSINLNNGSRIWVQKGAATVGNLRLGADLNAPIEWLTKNNVLESSGNITINGRLMVDRGLASIISHNGNITISHPAGEIETNGGELHLEAQNGKILASGGNLPLSGNITALEVEAATINCKNLIAMNVIANSLTITENATISTYGIDISGTASIGGNLVLENLSKASRLGAMTVDGSVDMTNAGNVALTSLKAGSDISIDGGTVTGTRMSGKNITLGARGHSTSLALNGLGINDTLEAGDKATLRVGTLGNGTSLQTDTPPPAASGKTGIFAAKASLRNSTVSSSGQEISVGGGSLSRTSLTATKGDISIASTALSDSSLAAGRDVSLSGQMTFSGSGDFVGAARNLTSLTALSGTGLQLYAENSMTAPAISAARVVAASLHATGDARVTGSIAAGTAQIGGNLSLAGAPYAYGAFNDLRVGGAISLRNATLASGNASAASIALSGAYPTEFNVVKLADGANLAVGENGYASLGQLEDNWLRSHAPASATHGALGIYSPVKVRTLQVGAQGARSGGINFGPQSYLLINGPAALETANRAGAISATQPVQANIANGAKIAFTGDVRPNNVYVALGSNITTHYASGKAWDDNNLESGSHLVALKKIAERPGSFRSSAVPSSGVYPDLDGSLGGVVDDAINRPGSGGVGGTEPGQGIPSLPHPTPGAPAVPGIGDYLPVHPPVDGLPDDPFPAIPAGPEYVAKPPYGNTQDPYDGSIGSSPWHLNSSIGGIRFLSRVTSTLYMDHDYRGAMTTLESSARMAILGAVPQMAYAANSSAVDAALQRAAFSAAPGLADVKAEDVAGHAFALWIMPLLKSVHGFDLHANNFGYDFNGNLGGVAAGADWTFGNMLRAGFDVSMGGGYSQSGGDLAKTTNRMGFFGAGLYGGLQMDQLGLVLDAHYTGTWNDLSQELPTRLEMSDLSGDLAASALSAGLRAEYRLPLSPDWELLPHAAARYAWIHVDKYTFCSHGAVLDGDAIDQQIWSFPFGMAVKGDFASESGWRFAPMLDVQAIPIAGNVEARLKGRYVGTRPDFQIYTQTMDYFTAGASIGIEARKGDFSLGARVDMQAGLRGSMQSAFANFCYEF